MVTSRPRLAFYLRVSGCELRDSSSGGMQHVALAGPLFIGGTLKIAYDVALYASFRPVVGETLTATAVDSVNTFDSPNTVVPKPVSAKVEGDHLTVTLQPKSVTVLAVRQ